MNLFSFKATQGNIVWIEPNKIVVNGRERTADEIPSEGQLTAALNSIPPGPTKWILDDALTPSALVKDIMEVPRGSEARDAFFRWKFGQVLAVDGQYSVQGVPLGEHGWLLAGMPLDLQDAWTNLAAKLGRHVHAMVPRWLWLYNRVAATREMPGMLLSLCHSGNGEYTGSIVSWWKTLTLVRQWSDAAPAGSWISDRIEPTIAFLQRDGKTPMELLVWGPDDWPKCPLPHKVFQPAIASQEAV